MTSKFSVWVKKFAVPVIFVAISLFMLIVGIREGQGTMFMIATVMMVSASILSILYSTGKLNTKVVYFIGGLTGVIALLALYFSYQSVKETQIHNENYKFCKKLAIQNLMDIREVQKIHRTQKGIYAGTWGEFEQFLKTGKVEYVKSKGTVPSRKITQAELKYLYNDNRPIDYNMTEVEAWRLSKWPENPSVDKAGNLLYEKDFKNFVRDTTEVSLLETRFTSNRAYLESRTVNEFPAFNPDSLKFIPFTNAKEMWKLETRDSVKFGESIIPTIKVSGFIPFADIKGKNNNKEEIYFGNLLTNSLNGSWEE